LANGFKGFGPQVPVIVRPLALPRTTEGLAGEPRCDDINHALICPGVPAMDECSDIAEYRGFLEKPVLDPLRDNPLAVSVIFHIPDRVPTQ
jgi:hypothetical protein